MKRNEYSKKREDFIHRKTDALNKKIDKSQNRLKAIIDQFILGLSVDGDTLKTDDNTFLLSSKLDRAYDTFLTEEVKPILSTFSKDVNTLLKTNEKYFNSVKKNDLHEQIKDATLAVVGIGGTVVLGGSLLYSILSDRTIINTIKSQILGGVTSGNSITALKISIEELITKKEGGLLKSLFDQSIPDPFVKIDRFIGAKYATGLKLNYAIYQGGLIKTSRPFCIERNNKVFSRDEIARFGTPYDRFGGYENKATGDFQGKTDPYDPFVDVGGYRCRHALDWVSDELAFRLRPDLKGKSISPGLPTPQLN